MDCINPNPVTLHNIAMVIQIHVYVFITMLNLILCQLFKRAWDTLSLEALQNAFICGVYPFDVNLVE